MRIFLPVNKKTGEVEYYFVHHRVWELPPPESLELIAEWEWKPFTISKDYKQEES